ncbi:hypothetical protein WG66_012873 [Moniliophthora roreri]|nr:hypothetical protein WG66_012873 [Moniliophthora roreri]
MAQIRYDSVMIMCFTGLGTPKPVVRSYDLAQQVLEGVPSESSLRSYAPEKSTIPEVMMDNLTAFDSRHIPTNSSTET